MKALNVSAVSSVRTALRRCRCEVDSRSVCREEEKSCAAAALHLARATCCVVPWISGTSKDCETSSKAGDGAEDEAAGGEEEARICRTSRSLLALPVTKVMSSGAEDMIANGVVVMGW